MWLSIAMHINSNCKRMNNGSESFRYNYNELLHSHHPNIYVFMDVIKKIQAFTYFKLRTVEMLTIVHKPGKKDGLNCSQVQQVKKKRNYKEEIYLMCNIAKQIYNSLYPFFLDFNVVHLKAGNRFLLRAFSRCEQSTFYLFKLANPALNPTSTFLCWAGHNSYMRIRKCIELKKK